MKLRPYQTKAAREVLSELRAGKATLLVAPTGSGKTIIAAEVAKNYKNVLVIAHRRELVAQARRVFGWHVSAVSVQSLIANGSDLADLIPKHVDLLIIDEAQRAAAKTYVAIRERFKSAALLGLTAAPVRTDGKSLGDVFSAMVVSSGVKELVQQKYLVPYGAFEAPDVALEEIERLSRRGGDYAVNELAEVMNRPRLVGKVVEEYLKHGRGRKAIVFAVNVKHSLALAKAFVAAGVRAVHLDGNCSNRLRDKALESLAAGKTEVVCNVNLFTEGWDCPTVSCVIMARPTLSEGLYLQCVGRGMRPSEGKSNLLILDHSGNIERLGYPDEEREWSLESEAERKKRVAEVAECERIWTLGYGSLEQYELEQKAKREATYSFAKAKAILGRRPNGLVTPIRKKYIDGRKRVLTWVRYLKSDVDSAATMLAGTYSARQCFDLLRVNPLTLAPYLRRRNIEGVGSGVSRRYPKGPIDELLKERPNDAYTAKEVACLLGVSSTQTAMRVLAKVATHGNTESRGGTGGARLAVPKTEVDEVLAALRDNYTPEETGRLLGWTSGVNVQAKREGIRVLFDRTVCIRYSSHDVDRLLAARAGSYSPAETVKLLGCSRSNLSRLLKRHGVTPIGKSYGAARYEKSVIDNLVSILHAAVFTR